MVVEHAERFGLAALHQLRGRVGRAHHQSYAFFVYSPNLTEDGKRRLRTMLEQSDGFALAEEDLKIRGPGDFAGVRQSGYLRLRIADISTDLRLMTSAREDAFSLLREDPGLLAPDHEPIRTTLQEYADSEPAMV
jgi:ATP-dependent DNA helicase RecG